MKTITPVLFVAGLLAATLGASAQIREVYGRQTNHTAESLVMGITAYSAGTFTAGLCNWTSPTAPASLSAGGSMTGGPNDGYVFAGTCSLSCSGWAANASNAGSRGVIRGKNNNGGTASTMVVGCSSTNAVQVVIWGPTLNSYGLTGATNFTWVASAGNGYTNSGTGEASFTVPQYNMSGGALVIAIIPSNDNELGSVMGNFYN